MLCLIQQILGPLTSDQYSLFLENPLYEGIRFPEFGRPETLASRYLGIFSKRQLNLGKHLLHMDPDQRLSAEECTAHPYFDGIERMDHNSLRQDLGLIPPDEDPIAVMRVNTSHSRRIGKKPNNPLFHGRDFGPSPIPEMQSGSKQEEQSGSYVGGFVMDEEEEQIRTTNFPPVTSHSREVRIPTSQRSSHHNQDQVVSFSDNQGGHGNYDANILLSPIENSSFSRQNTPPYLPSSRLQTPNSITVHVREDELQDDYQMFDEMSLTPRSYFSTSDGSRSQSNTNTNGNLPPFPSDPFFKEEENAYHEMNFNNQPFHQEDTNNPFQHNNHTNHTFNSRDESAQRGNNRFGRPPRFEDEMVGFAPPPSNITLHPFPTLDLRNRPVTQQSPPSNYNEDYFPFYQSNTNNNRRLPNLK